MDYFRKELLRLAAKFDVKYALDASGMKEQVQQAVQTAVANASTQKSSGIMPFTKMAAEDQSVIHMDVSRNGDTVYVANLKVMPYDNFQKYKDLPQQVETYLTRNLDVFPTQIYGSDVDYHNLTITLSFGSQPSIASNIKPF